MPKRIAQEKLAGLLCNQFNCGDEPNMFHELVELLWDLGLLNEIRVAPPRRPRRRPVEVLPPEGAGRGSDG